jgi:hypothetical protein
MLRLLLKTESSTREKIMISETSGTRALTPS